MDTEKRGRVFYDDGSEMTPWIDLPDRTRVPDYPAMLAVLAAESEIFFSMRDLTPQVLCNDTFAYACADCEQINNPDDLQRVFEMFEANRKWGCVQWCVLRRRQRPLPQIEEMMKRDGAWTTEIESAVSP